jgi:hypothetical protein
MSDAGQARLVFGALREALGQEKHPVNALVVWTELGRALAGALELQGADRGLLGEVIANWLDHRGLEAIELNTWVPGVGREQRLGGDALGAAIRRAEQAVERTIPGLAGAAENPQGKRELFMTVVRGWFPLGLELMRAMPAGASASDDQVRGALGAWCEKYLPRPTGGPSDLGVRIQR